MLGSSQGAIMFLNEHFCSGARLLGIRVNDGKLRSGSLQAMQRPSQPREGFLKIIPYRSMVACYFLTLVGTDPGRWNCASV